MGRVGWDMEACGDEKQWVFAEVIFCSESISSFDTVKQRLQNQNGSQRRTSSCSNPAGGGLYPLVGESGTFWDSIISLIPMIAFSNVVFEPPDTRATFITLELFGEVTRESPYWDAFT